MTSKRATGTKRLPKPPLPEDLDFSSMPYMPLFERELARSKAWAMCARVPFLAFYMMNLWRAAFFERPACSLPNDDDLLCRAAQCPPPAWGKVRDKALHGFVLHSNGRLYQPIQVEHALKVVVNRHKEAERKRRYRSGKHEQDQGDEGTSHGTEGGTGPGQGPLSPQDGALNVTELNITKEREEVDRPRASSTKIRNKKKSEGEDARATGPTFRRHLGAPTLAQTLAQAAHQPASGSTGRHGAVEFAMPTPGAAVAAPKKDQGLADQHMVEALIAEARENQRSMSNDEAWAIVMAARDRRHPRHAEYRQRCDALSRRRKVGWFGNEMAHAERPVTA